MNVSFLRAKQPSHGVRPTLRELQEVRRALTLAQAELLRLRADERSARQMALHDPLTALPNRRYFFQRFESALAQPAPQGRNLAVLYMDLDGFKTLNDRLGHDAGDRLLRIVASRLVKAVRAEDMVCRLGGDEFACLMFGMPNRGELDRLANKLHAAVSGRVQLGSTRCAVRPSIGIATYPDGGRTAEALLRSADEAMYRAKRTGSTIMFFEPSVPPISLSA